MKSIFSIFVLFISLVTLTACANNTQPSIITINDSDTLTTITVTGDLLEDELHFKDAKYDINIQPLGDNMFHIDMKMFSKSIDKVTGDESVSSRHIVTQLIVEPEEKVTLGGLDLWSQTIHEDGSVIETRVVKRYVLEVLKSS